MSCMCVIHVPALLQLPVSPTYTTALMCRTREDTVRCIVASLIDDSGSDLADVGVQ